MASTTKRLPFRYAEVQRFNDSHVDEIESFDNHVRPSSRSWRAVTTMLTALLLGALFATSQHLMNAYLNERDVNSVKISSSWVSRLNTALAFLVKTCLVITIGVAFVQRQWLKMHNESLRVGEIDALTGVLGNIFDFFGTSVWFHHPLMTLMALCAWTIPIASIITPGSISIGQRPVTNTTSLQVPQYDWAGTGYSITPCCGAYGTVFAQAQTYKIAYTSGMLGDSLSLPSQYPNQSYHLTFYGPAVQCGMANSTVREEMSQYLSVNSGGDSLEFMSWVPADAVALGLKPNGSAPTGYTSTYASLDELSMDASRIFMTGGLNDMMDSDQASVIECVLHNATYDVDFIFAYPGQSRNISSVQLLNRVSANSFIGPDGVNATGNMIASYAGVMDAFGRLLVGRFSTNQYGFSTITQTSYNLLSIDWNHTDTAYKGLESLFHNITLSFLSDSTFTKNSTAAAFVPVTATFWPIKYVYIPWELWLAYGLSGGISLICLLVGLHAFIQNGGSYQNIFSTFVRATSHHEELRRQVSRLDTCDDPLPKDLGSTSTRLELRRT